MNGDHWNRIKVYLPPQSNSASSPSFRHLINNNRPNTETFHIAHKVPVGDSPYVRAKRVQLVEKNPEKAISLFWAAINAGDRVDSALKDMAIVMKQQNRAEEAIQAIMSFRDKCSDQAQESLDNILLDLYKRCGRLDDQIALLRRKLQLIQQGFAFNGKRTKTARSQGKKFQVSIQQEATRLLGNLGWALMQKESYKEAEEAYRNALVIEPDNNKMCNLGICLMKQGRIVEAKNTLKQVKPATIHGIRGADSHLKAYERAQEMLSDLESKWNNSLFFDYFTMSSSSIWKPQPCADYKTNCNTSQALNKEAKPFYPPLKENNNPNLGLNLPLNPNNNNVNLIGNLKRSRSFKVEESEHKRKPISNEEVGNRFPELPDDDAFDEAILEAVLGPVLEDEEEGKCYQTIKGNVEKRPRVFEDITVTMNSPRGKKVSAMISNLVD